MAQKKFNQNFAADFTGIDGESTPLEPDSNGVNRAVNLEQAVGNSLRGRVGCQVAGSPGGFFAIFPYSYTRTQDEYAIKYQTAAGASPNQTPTLSTTKTAADGDTVNKLIAINQQAWVRDVMTIPITNVTGAYPITWYTTVSSSNIHFIIKANGTTILDSNLGDGLATGNQTIYGLLNAIDATAEFSCAVGTRTVTPPLAIVNGNQTTAAVGAVAYGSAWSVTVNAGHTFQVGDMICFPLNPIQAGFVIARTGTTITYVGNQVTLLNNDVLGYLGQKAAGFEISTVGTTSSSPFNLSIPYWRLIPEGSGGSFGFGNFLIGGYALFLDKPNSYIAPSATNANGCLFTATSSAPLAGFKGVESDYLSKIDGLTITNAGLPKGFTAVTKQAGGALLGTYRYKTYLKKIDAQGNIIEGTPSDPVTVVYTAPNQTGVVTASVPPFTGTGQQFSQRSCYKATTDTPLTDEFWGVDDNAGGVAFIQPGDPLVFTDSATTQTAGLWRDAGLATPLGALMRSSCTGYDAVAGEIQAADTGGATIGDNSEVSTGMTVVFLRTAAGGNTYYVMGESPVTGYPSTFTLYDNVTDAVLTAKAQFEPAPLGKEHDAPPACGAVCQHQGGLVVARGSTTPNTVAFSSADGIEYFPTASNSFDVPATQAGPITAIASDTADRLAVFKEKAYYDIQGDLDGGSFSVNVINEGDYGITSQASLVRVHNALIGLSKLGYVTIQDGNLNPFKFKDLNTRLINQNYKFSQAVAVNDYFNRNYTCCIPTGSGFVTHVIDYSRIAVKTFERSYPSQIDQAGGMAMVGDTLYHLSATSPYAVFRRLYRFNGDSPTGNNGDSFIDNTSAISYIFETNPISNDEPDVLNTPIRLRLWSLPNDYVIEGWVPFSVLVEGGCSPLAAYVGSAYPGGTSSTLTFATANDIFKDTKLVSLKTHFYVVRLTTNAIRTAPFITGFEVMYAEDYKKEDLVK